MCQFLAPIYGQIPLHRIHTYFIYPCTYPWTFGLFLFFSFFFGYYEWCCYKHSWASFVGAYFFISLVYMPENKFWIICLRKEQTVFQSCCTIWHSYQQYMKVPITSHFHQYLLQLQVMFDYCHLADVNWYPTVVWIFISPVTNEVEPFFHMFINGNLNTLFRERPSLSWLTWSSLW